MNILTLAVLAIFVLLAALWVLSATWQDDDYDDDELPDVIRKRKDI